MTENTMPKEQSSQATIEFVTGTDILVDGEMIAGRSWSGTMARWEGLGQVITPG